MKKALLTTLLLAALVFTLVACGINDPISTSNGPNGDTTPDVTIGDTTPQLTTPESTTAAVTTAGDATTTTTTPAGTTPEVTTPVATTPEMTTPEATTPEVTTPEATTPDVTTPVVTPPEVTTPEVTTPEVTTPEVTTPEVTTPVVTPPEVTTPEVTTPVVTPPEVTTPEVTTPVVTPPADSTPSDTEPPMIFVSKIEITASSLSFEAGETIKISAEIFPADATDKHIIWKVSGGTLKNGAFTATKAGEYTITATSNDISGTTAKITVTVTPAKVSKITISGGTSVTVGKTLQLKVSVTPDYAADKSVTWSIVSGDKFATISSKGLLTAKAAGSVTVKATANDGSGKYATATISVTPIKVSSIVISAPSKTVAAGNTLQLSVTVSPENAADKNVTWSISAGSKYASISSDGLLTAKAVGSVTVKAVATDGSKVYATYKISVTEPQLFEGSGTSSDPFLIRNLTDLMNLTKVINKSGYYFKQVADIDCAPAGEWIQIGNPESPFRHHYNGGGYTISNLCLDGNANALFCEAEYCHFKNINIVNAHTKDNHQTYENQTGKHPGNGGCTAALVGYAKGCSFSNCTAVVNFQSSNDTTGGLIGFAVLKDKKHTLMENCHVSGTITGSSYLGGLVGRIWNYMDNDEYKPSDTITISNCSADVEIIIFTSSLDSTCVGGLIGESFGVRIEKCHTKGSINVLKGDLGGLVGKAGNYTDVIRCYSDVNIHASTDNHYGGVSAGGLIGHIYSRSDVIDCYATGNITAPDVEWSPCQDSTNRNGGPWRRYYNPCGSLIGTLEVFEAYSEDQKITVYNCYATGKVDVPNICEDKRVYCHGALIGLVLDRNTVLTHNIKDPKQKDQSSWDCFKEYYIGHFGNNYNIENLRTYYSPINDYEGKNMLGLQNPKYTALPQHEYVEIITEAELKQQSTFEGWDFQNVWKMGENGPELR